jgi:glucose/arabinose dehydrogenase
MPIAYTVYLIAVTFATSVAVSMLSYGSVDYVRRSNASNGLLDVAAGGLIALYLVVFHFETLIRIPGELLGGTLVSSVYVVLPAVVGLVTTDYLLRRVVPLLSLLVPGDMTPEHEPEPTTPEREPETTTPEREPETHDAGNAASRRSVLGAMLGTVAISLAGGITVLQDALGSPTPEANTRSEFRLRASFEAPRFPTAMSFTERGYGFVTTLEGRIFRFEPPSSDGDSLSFTEVASGLRSPQGIEAFGDTLYTVDNGNAGLDKSGGYEALAGSNGTVIAFDIEDGSLTNERAIVSNLPVVNRDHALHQIVRGPDDRLYLSIGHLGGTKYPELFDGDRYAPSDEDHPKHEYLGTVIAFDPDGSNVEVMASGLRNVYDIAFDRDGNLYGAENDGMSVRSKVWPSLYHITEDAYFGYPEYGTFDAGPSGEDAQDPLWVLDGVSPTGIETADKVGARDGVVVGLTDKVVLVPIERGDEGVFVPEFLRPEPTITELDNRPMIVEAGPDGDLWVGSTGITDTLSVYTTDS